MVLARTILDRDGNGKILLPVDHVTSERPEGAPVFQEGQSIGEDLMGLDIGVRTLEQYRRHLERAKTIFWNGPMGFFENDDYSGGTREIARILAESSAYTVVGGGDSARAVRESGVFEEIGHVSTGGGAALEFIQHGGNLPGIRALKFGPELL